jgi:hypothetical protein
MHLNGQYEGKVVIYEADKYPYSCLGPVRYLWKPLNDVESAEKRLLWLWTHPSIFNQIKTQFIKIFEIKIDEDAAPPESKKAKLDEDSVKLNNLTFKNDKITIQCLKDKLIRFKLLGPLSTTILSYALKIEDFNKFDKNVDLSTLKWSNNEELLKFYWENQFNLEKIKNQESMWNKIKNISNPGDITPSHAIGLLVKDPRLVLPKKKLFNTVKEENKKNFNYKLDDG